MAELSSEIIGNFRVGDVLRFCGGGWHRDRQHSQEKAIVEAIERWAFKNLLDQKADFAGLEWDSTSNGFAAVPSYFGERRAFEHSYCESLERYALNLFWEERRLPLKKVNPTALRPELRELFRIFKGHLTHHHARLAAPNNSVISDMSADPLHFVLTLFWREDGGVLPGSACGPAFETVIERATLEAFNHMVAVMNIERGDVRPSHTVTDRRLVRFGSDKKTQMEIDEAIQQCEQIHEISIAPSILLARRFCGPWEPEVIVTRVLVANSRPINEGDDSRFFI